LRRRSERNRNLSIWASGGRRCGLQQKQGAPGANPARSPQHPTAHLQSGMPSAAGADPRPSAVGAWSAAPPCDHQNIRCEDDEGGTWACTCSKRALPRGLAACARTPADLRGLSLEREDGGREGAEAEMRTRAAAAGVRP